MIGTPIKIKNHDTGEEIVLNDHDTDPDNVIALQTFPSFDREIRAQNTPRPGAHGEFRLPMYYSGMSIILQGIIVGENEASVWAIKRKLDSVMKLSRKGFANDYTGDDRFPPMGRNTIRLSFTNPLGQDVFVDATPIQVPSYDRPLQQNFLLNFQVILRSNMPYLIVEDEVPAVTNGTLGSLHHGLKMPFQLPLSLNNEYVEGEMTVNSETPAFAVVTLKGSDDGLIINPTITNLTNGTSTKIRRPLAGANRHFKIDGLYQTMTDQGGNDVMPYSDGNFVFLDAGENTLLYTADRLIPN